MEFTFWDDVDKSLFLRNDRANTARKAAAKIIRGEMPSGRRHSSMLEVGCGPGFDYGDHFRKIKRLKYTGIDGAAQMIEHCKQQWPDGDFKVGDFTFLAGAQWDFVYCKAVLEHQPDFRDPLAKMLRATRLLCLVNWYLPPSDTESYTGFNTEINVHYNRYKLSDVKEAVAGSHFSFEERTVKGSPNVLHLYRPL